MEEDLLEWYQPTSSLRSYSPVWLWYGQQGRWGQQGGRAGQGLTDGVFIPQGSNSPQAALAEGYRVGKCPRLSGNQEGRCATSVRVSKADLRGKSTGNEKC